MWGLKIRCWNLNLLKNFTWQRGHEGYGAFCWFGSEWCEVHCSASWSPWEPVRWPGSEQPNLQVHIPWKKTPTDQCKFSSFLRFCCLVTNFWEMVSGGGKHIFILEYSVIDDWYGCAKKTLVLLSCWACSMGPMGLGLISLAWCDFHALSLWCVENFRNWCVRSVCLVCFCCWSF